MTQRSDAQLKTDATTYINDNTAGDVTPADVRVVTDNLVDSKINNDVFNANTILYASTADTPAVLTIAEQTVVGRVTGGEITDLAIDSDISSVSASNDTLASAKAIKTDSDNRALIATTAAQAVGTGDDVVFNTIQLVNGTSINELSIDGTLAGNSDDAAPTEKAVKTYADGVGTAANSYTDDAALQATTAAQKVGTGDDVSFTSIHLTTGATPTEFSIDGTLAGNSDIAVPTEKAVKTYSDALTTKALTLTNKTIDADNNTIADLTTTNLKSGVLLTTVTGASNTTLLSALASKNYSDGIGTTSNSYTDSAASQATTAAQGVGTGDDVVFNSVTSGELDIDNINVNGNTITAAINTDLNLNVSGTGRVKIGKAFGGWTIDTNTVGTNYLAATDLFICAHIGVGNQQGWAIEGYTDSNAVPTQLITRDSANLRTDGGNTTFVNYGSIMFPVRKGDYWRVDEVVINAATGPTDLVINTMAFGA